jgi:hypothetical protein
MKEGIQIKALVIIAMMLIVNQASAAPLKDVMSQRYEKEKDIGPVVVSCIKEGMNTREVVKTAIDMGHSACYVVKSSLGGGGGLEETIFGAIDAGATTDVCSRCAIEGGAYPQDVAKVLEQQGLAYTTAGTSLTPISVAPPGGNSGGKNLSPSTFK